MPRPISKDKTEVIIGFSLNALNDPSQWRQKTDISTPVPPSILQEGFFFKDPNFHKKRVRKNLLFVSGSRSLSDSHSLAAWASLFHFATYFLGVRPRVKQLITSDGWACRPPPFLIVCTGPAVKTTEPSIGLLIHSVTRSFGSVTRNEMIMWGLFKFETRPPDAS